MSAHTTQMSLLGVKPTTAVTSQSATCAAALHLHSLEAPGILAAYPATRKTGHESFTSNGQPLETRLIDFWQWSVSDLVSNATRGRLAEFIVASALDTKGDVRSEWDAYDLETIAGLKIEVKSCGYLQSWKQKKLSPITFSVRKARSWEAVTGKMEKEATRHAHLYIFALLTHKASKQTLDPLNLDQWLFYLVPTQKLNERTRSQHSITLKSLEALCPEPVPYSGLKGAVAAAEAQNRLLRLL